MVQTSSQSTVNKIEMRLRGKGRGSIVFQQDYADCGTPSAVKSTFHRMYTDGMLVRLAHGIYYYPKEDKEYGLGIIYPSVEDIAQAIAKRDKAKAILAKYADLETRLLPKINQNIYNRQIKKILKLLGIDRMVTVIDNKTREPIQKPICDIATIHTARKTFIGNLYKKVKDPNLVASLSGHTDGSRAFARYREIDNEMKRELVKLID